MLFDLIDQESRFRPYLKAGDYAFIGPEDPDQLKAFYKLLDKVDPGSPLWNGLHSKLSDTDAVHQVLSSYPENTRFRIYVVSNPQSGTAEFPAPGTIEDYCKANGITFPAAKN